MEPRPCRSRSARGGRQCREPGRSDEHGRGRGLAGDALEEGEFQGANVIDEDVDLAEGDHGESDELEDEDEFEDDPEFEDRGDEAEFVMDEFDEDEDDKLTPEEFLSYFLFDEGDGKSTDQSKEVMRQKMLDADGDRNGGLDIQELILFFDRLDAEASET
mmetsp:Transcript_102631/g.295531  ORF Transcript_102631/g.295531 Transcript_102631/m.295531 type:complete len:160 (+) Transcript_102631:65-544(+)